MSPPSAKCGPIVRKKRGFNLIEAEIVLGVIGLVIGGIWVAAAAVNSHIRINRALVSIEQIFGGLDSLYQGRLSASTNYTSLLMSSGAIAADLVQNGSAVDPWGGSLDVRTPYPGVSNVLRITFDNVPSGDCLKFVSKAAGSLNSDGSTSGIRGMTGISVNGSGYTSVLVLSGGLQALLSAFKARCTSASSVTVRFEYEYPHYSD